MIATALAAPLGTLVGAALHEASHAVAAELLGGRVVDVGWRGGLTGGPFVSWEAPDNAGWRPVAVGVAPVLTALVVAVGFAASNPKGLTAWFGAAGSLIGLLWLSEEDVDPQQARETFETAD
jgi:hypothetical protein